MKFKNILVLYKESNYKLQLHGRLDLKHDHPFLNKLKVFLMNEHERHYQSLEDIKKVLNELKLKFKVVSRGKFVNYDEYDCVITIGGDGTFLQASRYVDEQFVIGVNSAPNSSVGKFCLTDANHFKKSFIKVLNGELKPSKIYKMEGKFSDGEKDIHAINDLLIAHHNPAALSRYIVEIDRKKEIQKSSGIWISTAAGSTGAIRSAGGELMDIDSRQVQYKPRELYDYKKNYYAFRGGILKERQKLKITSIMKGAAIYIDGAHIKHSFPYGTTLSVGIGKKHVKAYLKN